MGKHVQSTRLDTNSIKSEVGAMRTGLTGMHKTVYAIGTAVNRAAKAVRSPSTSVQLGTSCGGSQPNGAVFPVPSSPAGIFDVPRLAPWTGPLVVRFFSSNVSVCAAHRRGQSAGDKAFSRFPRPHT